MKVLVLVGRHKVSGRAIHAVRGIDADVTIGVDASPIFSRVLRLLWRRKLSISLLFRILIAELLRRGTRPPKCYPRISSNEELRAVIKVHMIDCVVLYHVGMIISKRTIGMVPILNIHCAKLPDFAGLGAIARAIEARQFCQAATIHTVTSEIDCGVVLDTEPYYLNPSKQYRENEDAAYEAGLCLLVRYLTHLST